LGLVVGAGVVALASVGGVALVGLALYGKLRPRSTPGLLAEGRGFRKLTGTGVALLLLAAVVFALVEATVMGN
jgi:hypothetical protein